MITTRYEETRKGGEWDVYPRPGLKRDSYYPMNGSWELFAGEKSIGTIEVPFPPESRLSGVDVTPSDHARWRYVKSFRIPEDIPSLKPGEKLLLHVGAADQIARVFLNGVILRSHEGGYLPFETELNSALKEGENVLEIVVRDEHRTDLPLGKQSLKRGGMWYTAHSGIWQPVWMEILPAGGIRSIETEITLKQREKGVEAEIDFLLQGGEGEKTLTIGSREHTFTGNHVRMTMMDPRLWTPEDPYLYPVEIRTKTDTVTSYLGIRTITIEKHQAKDGREIPCICLNGKPRFMHGLLDQGYYPDGIVIPATPEGYSEDIARMKDLGFDLLRKHIKVEPDWFYYECDRQGMLVMQDMVNSGVYRYMYDTILPTIGLQHLPQHKASLARQTRFEADARTLIRQLKNHPCLMGFTIFNEGWGQYEASRLYKELKGEFPEILFDSASGWFKGAASDVVSDHIYFKELTNMKPDPKGEKPLTLSEYGGYVWSVPGHRFNEEKEYGYKKFDSEEALLQGLKSLYEDGMIPVIKKGLNLAILTQVSDVEDETNGMLTYDRKVVKVNSEAMRDIAQKLKATFDNLFA